MTKMMLAGILAAVSLTQLKTHVQHPKLTASSDVQTIRASDTSAPQRQRAVAITIDDLPVVSPGPESDAWERTTDGILAALVRHGAPATGFVNESKLYDSGELMPSRVALLRRWLTSGHQLGNHTFSHPKLYDTPIQEYVADILRGEQVTRELVQSSGGTLRYFRHPFLNTGNSLEQRDDLNDFLADRGYVVAPVTIDNYDYEFARVYENALRIGDSTRMRRIGEAYIDYMLAAVEFYETQSSQILQYELPQILLIHANRLNADWLDGLLSAISQRGYEFVTLGDALSDKAYQRPDTVVTRFGFSWLHRWAITANMDRAIFRGEPVVPDWILNWRERGGG